MKSFYRSSCLLSGFVLLAIAGCGGSGGGANVQSLSSLPSTSSLVATSGSANSALLRAAVSGTPPAIGSIATADVDDLFFNGLLAQIGNGEGLNSNSPECNTFFNGGNSDGSAGGSAACHMTQSVGFSFEPIINAGTSACYMKNIPNSATGISITDNSGTGITAENIFTQGTSDKVILVQPDNEPPRGEGEEAEPAQNIFIKVIGSDNLSGDIYKVELWFCSRDNPEANPNGYEVIEVNRATGEFNSTNIFSEGNDEGQATISAFLTEGASGSFLFDPTKNRQASISHSGDFGEDTFTFKGEVTITPSNQILTKTYDVSGRGADSFTRLGYSIAEYTGDSIKELAFTQGAYKDQFSRRQGEDTESNGSENAFEFRDTFYAVAPNSSLLGELDDVNFASDSFYTAAPSVSTDTSGYDCGTTADATVSMDFSDTNVAAISAACEADRFDNSSNYCWSEAVFTAENALFEACVFTGP